MGKVASKIVLRGHSNIRHMWRVANGLDNAVSVSVICTSDQENKNKNVSCLKINFDFFVP